MGLTYIKGTVCNSADPARSFEDEFLVDTGSLFSFAPREKLAAIGIGPHRTEKFRQMDGTIIERQVGRALLKLAGKEEVVPVVLGEPADATVLGVVALEALALGVESDLRPASPGDAASGVRGDQPVALGTLGGRLHQSGDHSLNG